MGALEEDLPEAFPRRRLDAVEEAIRRARDDDVPRRRRRMEERAAGTEPPERLARAGVERVEIAGVRRREEATTGDDGLEGRAHALAREVSHPHDAEGAFQAGFHEACAL